MKTTQWLLMSEQEPTIKDLPFLTVHIFGAIELWEDSDWFDELSEKERLEHPKWMPIPKPF